MPTGRLVRASRGGAAVCPRPVSSRRRAFGAAAPLCDTSRSSDLLSPARTTFLNIGFRSHGPTAAAACPDVTSVIRAGKGSRPRAGMGGPSAFRALDTHTAVHTSVRFTRYLTRRELGKPAFLLGTLYFRTKIDVHGLG